MIFDLSHLNQQELESAKNDFSDIDYSYHTFNFSTGDVIHGDYDIGQDISAYPFPDLKGLNVLDIGVGSGWFSLYFAKHGSQCNRI